ncbi:MAG: LysR substrate-binding domain-containing protein, partial [Bdellovibrionaceae bacterium]|nr:LysR substrate-binding domain-containing protein [Pseudobdellovibrionaceae bacterium]
LPITALEGERLLLLEDGHCLRDQALEACRSTRVEEASFRATSLPTLLQMVASGAGLTLLPELALPTETARAAVTVRPFADPVPHRTLGLAWRRNTYAREALRAIGKVLADNSGRG